nr:hypothetical protein EUGRSUZ_G01444 [Ipomoea batatas]
MKRRRRTIGVRTPQRPERRGVADSGGGVRVAKNGRKPTATAQQRRDYVSIFNLRNRPPTAATKLKHRRIAEGKRGEENARIENGDLVFGDVINTQVLKHHHILHLHLPPFAAPPVQSPLPHGVSPLERHHGRAALLDGAPHFPERFPDSLHGEVQDRHGPPHRERRLVIGQSRLLCFVEGSQPNPYPVPRRIPYLRRELPPRPPPHAAVRLLRSLRGHLLFLSRRRLRQNPEEEHFFGVINVEREGAVEIPAIPREIFRR